jgi:hypothetical protein
MGKVDVFIYENPGAPGEFLVRPAVAPVEKKGKVFFHAIGCDVTIAGLPPNWTIQGDEIGDDPILVSAGEHPPVAVKTVAPDNDTETPAEVKDYRATVTVTSLSVKALGSSDPVIIIHPPTN